MPLPYSPTQKDGRVVAESNELKSLKVLRLFGHLRRQELAMAVWPKSSPKSAYIMACRTTSRLLEQGLVLERTNSLGGKSLVLAAKGVARLRDQDLQAQEGYELAFDGPQFFHRTLGTCYLLHKAREGHEVFGEFAILKGWSPVVKELARDSVQKIPDGLISYDRSLFGYGPRIRPVDWVEVESAVKPYEEIRKAFNLYAKTLNLSKKEDIELHKLVFVCDARQKHDTQILRHAKQYLKENPNLNGDVILGETVIAKCYVDPPFVWHGCTEHSLKELLAQGYAPD